MNRDEAVEKVKKLLKVTEANGAGLGEVLTAAAHAQRLIAQFEIDQVLLAEKPEAPKFEDAPIIEKDLYLFKGPRVLTWALNLVGALGDVNGCKTWYYSAWSKNSNGKIKGCGREVDLDTVAYMANYLTNEVERLCVAAAKLERAESGSCSKTWTNSFKLGAVGQLSSRLREAYKQMKEEMRNPELAYKRAIESGDTQRVLELDNAPKYELAVIDNALIKLENRQNAAEEWAKKEYPGRWRSVSRTGSKSYGAYAKGSAAAKGIDIGGGHKRLNG